MSKLDYSNGKFFLTAGEQSALLLDVRNVFANRSRIHSHQLTEKGGVIFPLESEVNRALKNFSAIQPVPLAEVVTYLRIVARLLVKPQVHKILRVGQWSTLDEVLAEILPKFNPANKLYCLSETRPLWKIPSATFLFAEGGEYLLPENKFDTVIFPDTPPLEILLAVRDFGKIYFAAQNVEEPLKSQAKIFPLTTQAPLFELEISPQLRREVRRNTPQGIVDEKKSAIAQVVTKFPAVLKKFNALSGKKKIVWLDEYIAEVARAEKFLSEIFPELSDDAIKFNFNVFKECLIDLRLGNGSIARTEKAIRNVELGMRNEF